MAICKVIKQTEGWNIGDTVEAFEHRLKELVEQGIVTVVVPDVFEEVQPSAKKGRKKKGE